jgi:hypothetical protein
MGFAIAPLLTFDARAAELVAEQGQPPVPRPPVIGWISGATGVGGIGTQTAATHSLELTLGRAAHLMSLRYAYTVDTNGTSCDQFVCLDGMFSLPRSTNKELALQLGVFKRLYAGMATASLGVAGIRALKRGSHLLSSDSFFGTINHYDSTTSWTAGATAEVGAYLSSRFISLGPTLVADLNPVQPSWAFLVDLHIGWMGPGPTQHP